MRTNEDSTQVLYGMSLWWKKNWWTESWIEPWCWKSEGAREGVSREDEEMFRRLTLTEPARRTVPKERNPWRTPSESCESDETEDEGTEPFRAPPGLPDPLIEETRIREVVGCQTDETAKAENRLHPRYKQVKDARPFEGILTDKNSSELGGQKPLSVSSWNAGPNRGDVISSMVGSFHVIMVQEAETHYHEIITGAEQQFHIYQGAGQLILYNKSTFESEGVKIQEEIHGTSIYDSFGLKYFLFKARFRRPPKEGNSTYTAVSAYLSNTTAKRRDVAKQLLGQFRKVAVENDADIIAGDFKSSAYRDRGKAGVSSIQETWEKTLLIPPPDVVPM